MRANNLQSYCDTTLIRGVQPTFGWTTWQFYPPNPSSWGVRCFLPDDVRISSDATSVILSGAFPREDLIRRQRHPERCFTAWGSHLLSFFKNNLFKNIKITLLAVKRHPSKEGNYYAHSTIEGGIQGGCAFLFFYSLIIHSGIFCIDFHAVLQHQMRVKKYTQEPTSFFSKGG